MLKINSVWTVHWIQPDIMQDWMDKTFPVWKFMFLKIVPPIRVQAVSYTHLDVYKRQLQTMADRMHVTFTEVTVTPGDNDATVNAFRQALKPNTSLIVCTHASNVWGIRLPVERIASLGREYGIPILVDAAQSAGVLPIDLQDSGIDFLCTAGHKGLYGPMGTGILIDVYKRQALL